MSGRFVLLDTHVLLWILADSSRLKAVSWLQEYSTWLISPISFLELKFLDECGKVRLDVEKIIEALAKDERFTMKDISLDDIIGKALALSWTRDPFDRLLVAHSLAIKIPLGTVDKQIRKHHTLVV